MKNKKKIVYLILGIALLLFIGLYLIINYSEPNILDSKDKKWISDNGGRIIDIAVINDIPVYASNGSGVIFDFLNFVKEKTKLDFNKIPYLTDSANINANYKFEIVDGNMALTSNQLLIFSDPYVGIEKQNRKVNSINDLEGLTLGILKEDINNVSYYLENVGNIKYLTYDNTIDLFSALENNSINMAVIPHAINLDKTLKEGYYVNYFFNNLSKNVVLTMGSVKELNTILTKVYNKWFNENYVSDYNKTLLNYYINTRSINDKTKADLLSKSYVYGYVENYPYEFSLAGHMEGVAIEYIKRIVRLTDIDIIYQKYETIDELRKGISNGDVDIYFDYFNGEDSKYLKSKSVFIENYVILGKGNKHIVENLESLKGKNVATLSNNYLEAYLKANTRANVISKNSVSELLDEDLIVADKEVYSYYKNSKFKDYEILYSDIMSSDYSFMIKSTNSSFFNLFDYFINTNSYYNYRNNAYNSFNGNIFDKVTFEELYLIVLAIILVPIIALIIIMVLFKNKRKLKLIRRDDRKKYTDLMTSLKNRNYLNLNIDKWNQNKVYPQSIIVIDLNNTKYINDNYGREKGDLLIVRAASILINTQLENSEIIRSDGNEFIIYMIGYNENQVDVYTKKLSKSLSELPYGFGAAIGYSMITDNIKTIDDAINEATIAMQSDKESYK